LDTVLLTRRRGYPDRGNAFTTPGRGNAADPGTIPGLNLTREQARCLWAIDGPLCDRLLAHLVDTGFLARTPRATYVRHTGG
jgi:hypothetical protein